MGWGHSEASPTDHMQLVTHRDLHREGQGVLALALCPLVHVRQQDDMQRVLGLDPMVLMLPRLQYTHMVDLAGTGRGYM